MPDTRIEGTTPEEAGMRSSPLESRLTALEQRANTLLANLEKERQVGEEQKPEDKPATVGEVQVALDKLMQGVAAAVNGVSSSINEKIRDIGNILSIKVDSSLTSGIHLTDFNLTIEMCSRMK